MFKLDFDIWWLVSVVGCKEKKQNKRSGNETFLSIDMYHVATWPSANYRFPFHMYETVVLWTLFFIFERELHTIWTACTTVHLFLSVLTANSKLNGSETHRIGNWPSCVKELQRSKTRSLEAVANCRLNRPFPARPSCIYVVLLFLKRIKSPFFAVNQTPRPVPLKYRTLSALQQTASSEPGAQFSLSK